MVEVFDGRNEKIRLVIFGLSILWFIFGILTAIVGGQNDGIIGKNEKEYLLYDLKLARFAVALIPIGSLMMIMSYFGCCAAIKGSRRMTFSHLTVLSILIFIKLVMACILFAQFSGDHIQKTVEKNIAELLNTTELANVTDKHRTETLNGVVEIYVPKVHEIHFAKGCCGVKGPKDFEVDKIPYSCCDDGTLTRFHYCSKNHTFSFDKGCSDDVVKPIIEAKYEMSRFLMAISWIEIFICLFEFAITKNIKDI